MIERALHYFFTPIAAIRPYLVEKSVLLLVALDMWCLRLPAANRYDADDFNLAHFAWLDALGPTPSTGLYIGVALLVGFLAIAIAVAELGVWWRVALVVLYSYSWAMSRLDSFQHHYLLSWVLLCIAFFPRMKSLQVFGGDAQKEKVAPKPLVCAWAWALLGVLVAIVYVFTSAAKLDAVWLSGECMQQLQGTNALMQPVVSAFAQLGYSTSAFWQLVARTTIAVELLLAAFYLLPPVRDATPQRWIPPACLFAWLVAVGLHASFHFTGLKIGWFSAYMILLASAYFLPEAWLWTVGKPIAWLIDRLKFARVNAVIVAGVAVAVGWWIDLPGALPACAMAAILLLATMGNSKMQNSVGRLAASLCLSLALLVLVILLGNARSQFYPYRLGQLQRRGQFDQARGLIPKAEAYVDEDDLQGQNNLAWFFAVVGDESLRDGTKAIAYGTRSCELCEYTNISALDTLACAYAANGNFSEALATLRRAEKLLGKASTTSLAEELAEHQRLFRKQQPFVEASQFRYANSPR